MPVPDFKTLQANNPNLGHFDANAQFLYDPEFGVNGGWRAQTSYDVRGYRTPYQESLVAQQNSIFNLKPTWGVSALRDAVTPTDGSGISEINGELRLITEPLSAVNNGRRLQTLERGQYRPGTLGEAGVGIRIPVSPTGSQEAMWGYFDNDNGFGFGCNQSGIYTFYQSGSVTTKTFQTGWNINTLIAPCAPYRPLSLADGNIYQIRYGWYGYSTIEWEAITYNTMYMSRETVSLNRLDLFGAASIVDPNQPITVLVTGGASDGAFSVFVGGRKYSTIGGSYETQSRPVRELISNYTITAAQNVWQPLIAMRVDPVHGTSNRTNSVRVVYNGFEATADNPAQMMVTFGGTIAGTPTGWSYPTFWSATEAATQVRVAGTLTGTATGFAIGYALLPVSNQTRVALATVVDEVPLGAASQVILWGRKTSSSATIVSAVLRWDEQW